MNEDETWCSLWRTGTLTESEFRRLRAEGDVQAARGLLDPDAAREQRARLQRSWEDGDIQLIPRERTAPRLQRAMSGSFLTVVGEASALSLPSIAIVGTRKIPARDARRLRVLVDAIVRSSVAVVSGGAYGVDTFCHEAALRFGVPAVIVIAGGLCHPSPAGSRRALRQIAAGQGAVVSDRAPDRTPQRRDFVRRNAIIAALAEAVVVVAAPEGSGALETARVARTLGVPVLAVPGAFDDATFTGCHDLLRRGASICTGPEDVLEAIGVQPSLALTPSPRPRVSGDGEILLAALERGESIDEVVRSGALELQDAHRALLTLQLDGHVT